MPPRYSYWTILAGGLPTAFRAAERADLLPTFNRIREKHPDAEMKWFARGRLWPSPDDAQADLQRARVRRDRDWRPGGEHRDPRHAFATKRKRDNGRQQAPREQAPREQTSRQPPRREQAPRAHPRREEATREQFGPEHTRREQAPREPRRERSSARPPSKSAPTERRPAPPPKRRPR